jgi:hypothetical protein
MYREPMGVFAWDAERVTAGVREQITYACLIRAPEKPVHTIEDSHVILLTDPNKPSYASFSYAVPQGREAWQFWVAAAARVDSYVMGIAKAYRVGSDDKVDLVVLLPTDEQSDDDVETAAAYLRVSEKYEGKIFVLRAEPARPQHEMHLAALAGGYTDVEELREGVDMGGSDGGSR